MASTKALSPTYIVIDNNVLSWLNLFFCDCRACRLPTGRARLAGLMDWMGHCIELLCEVSADGKLHSTDCVADQFRPASEILAAFRPLELDSYRRYVRQQLATDSVSMAEARLMRQVPGARPELVGRYGVNDADLSLVLLAAQLASTGAPVALITDDQDLLDFTTWLRTRAEARERWSGLRNVQAIRDLVFLDLIHRSCKISTYEMQEMLNHVILRTAERLAGNEPGEPGGRPKLSADKGIKIIRQYQAAQLLVTKSAQEKAANKGVTV